MEVIIIRESLLPAISSTVGIIERRQMLPILSNVLLIARVDQLMITGTDLGIEIQASCHAQILKEGEITVPARKLMDICRNLAEQSEIKLQVKDNRCFLTADRSRFILGGLSAHEFPLMTVESDHYIFYFTEQEFKKLLDKTFFAMAQKDVRYFLNGLLLEFDKNLLTAVATDGHRLAKYQIATNCDIEKTYQTILPSKIVLDLRRQLINSDDQLQIKLGEKNITFIFRNLQIRSKLIEGLYPDYKKVIPANLPNTAIVNRKDLKSALLRTSILSSDKYRGAQLIFNKNILKILTKNNEQEEAEEEIEINYTGLEIAIGLNISYITDVINASEYEKLQIEFKDINNSTMWRGVKSENEVTENEIYVIMPMRI